MSQLSNIASSKPAKKKYRIALWWKLHIDTGEPLDVPPKDHETSYFKVEGKKRPAIVVYDGKTHSQLVVLTTQPSDFVVRLGRLGGDERVSYFDPRRTEQYPNKLKVNDLSSQLSHEQLQLFVEEMDRFSMKSRQKDSTETG